MVGYHSAWDGREIAPVSFANREGKSLEAWPDYWQQLREFIDLAYDRYGLRTQITIFADAQFMPNKADRIEHMRKLLADVATVASRRSSCWKSPTKPGKTASRAIKALRTCVRFAEYLNERTEIPIAITSNHDWPELGSTKGFDQVYARVERTSPPGISAGIAAPMTGGSPSTIAGSWPSGRFPAREQQ